MTTEMKKHKLRLLEWRWSTKFFALLSFEALEGSQSKAYGRRSSTFEFPNGCLLDLETFLSRRAAPPPQPMVSFVSWLACKPQILAHTRSLYPPFMSALQVRPRQTCSSGFQRAWHATLLSTDLRGPLARSLTSPSELRNIEDKTH
jgi:hypothetical protein